MICLDLIHSEFISSSTVMVSAVDRAKRALVTLLRLLATAYGCVADVTRDSSDLEIKSAYRKLSRKVHPDKGGLVADQTRLNCAYEGWQNEVKRAPGRGKAWRLGQNCLQGPRSRCLEKEKDAASCCALFRPAVQRLPRGNQNNGCGHSRLSRWCNPCARLACQSGLRTAKRS